MYKFTLVAMLCAAALPALSQPGMADLLKMQEAMNAAQANAIRPGDERLDCTDLEREMIAVSTDPALHDHVQQLGEQAQRDQTETQAGSTRIPIETALTIYAALVPGGDWAQVRTAQARMPAEQAKAANRVERIRNDGLAMMQFLPQMMRGQRVLELAHGLGCSWVPQGMGADG